MAITFTDHRSIYNEADDTTNWTGATSAGSTPTPVEATQWVGANLGAAIGDMYVTPGGTVDLSDAVIYVWIFPRLTLGNTTDANGGLMVYVGDASHAAGWKVGGADRSPFRHDDGPTFWMNLALDTTSLPASPLTRAGSGGASVNFAAITRIGATANSLQAAPGMDPTWYADIIRYFLPSTNNGCAVSIVGGTSGDPGTFAEIAAADRLVGNQQGRGILRQLAAGSYGCQAPLRFGNATGTDSSWFEDENAFLVFEDRGFRTTLYKVFITDNGTGTTTFKLTNCSLVAPPGVGASFDSLTDTDVTDVTITGTRFEGFAGGIGIGGGAGQVFTTCIFVNSGVVSVTSQSVNLTNSTVIGSTVAVDASSLLWNIATDPDGFIDDMTFSKGTNAHHAITFGASSPTTITLRELTLTGFNAADEQNDSVLLLADQGVDRSWTINAIGCVGTVSYKKVRAGDTVSVVVNPVTTRVNIKDFDGNNEAGVRVYLEAADGTGDLPYQQSITSITRSGTTATVTFAAAHGLESNEYLKLYGITDTDNQSDLSGAFQVTVTGATTLTYTTATTGPSPYNGTITGTGATIYGTTDAAGDISSSRSYSTAQPLTGYARKSDDGVTYFKPIDLDGIVDIAAGLTINRRLVSDGLV